MGLLFRKLFVLISILLIAFNSYGQLFKEYGVKSDYLGYGWIIAISNNLIFVPAKDSTRYPTINRFFEEENKFGFEITSQFHPIDTGQQKPVATKWVTIEIDWGKEGNDELLIIPVMAYYEWRDKEDFGGNQRVYKYQGKEDNVTYQIVSSFMFRYITLE